MLGSCKAAAWRARQRLQAGDSGRSPEDELGFEYEVVKVAPVYRQLLAHWTKGDTPVDGCYYTDDHAEFQAAGGVRGAWTAPASAEKR